MILNDVHQGINGHRKRKRIGRGPGSGHGKTAGRGHKGFYSRAGAKKRMGYEGGQMPLARRIAKRGFNNRQFAAVIAIVNVSALQNNFNDGDEITPDALREKGLVSGKFDLVKILGNGDLNKKFSVAAHRFSKSALEKIAAKGGAAVVLSKN